MPPKKYCVVTIKKTTEKKLLALAEKLNKSPPETILYAIEKVEEAGLY